MGINVDKLIQKIDQCFGGRLVIASERSGLTLGESFDPQQNRGSGFRIHRRASTIANSLPVASRLINEIHDRLVGHTVRGVGIVIALLNI